MGIRDVVIVMAWGGAVACQPGKGVSAAATIDDHDHLTVVATVDAMGQRANSGAGARHIRMLASGAGSAVDSARADMLVLQIRDALQRYRDVAAATADGFEELATADSGGGVTHLVNWKWAVEEAFRFNPTKPTALVYRTRVDGERVLLGVMYTAPDGASPDALDRRVPVRVGRWHQHVDWCTPKRGDDARWTEVGRDGAPMFGPWSRIATRAGCDSVAGAFQSHVFGWMVHANVFASDEPRVIWSEPAGVAAPAAVAVVDSGAAAPAPAPAPRVYRVAPPGSGSVSARVDTALPAAQPGFMSSGARVAYERFVPAKGGGRHAVVIMLPGGGGIGGDSVSAELRASAEALSKRGYVTEIVHYLDATGSSAVAIGDGFKNLPVWNRAVGDAITQVASDPGVDSTRIALLGLSFGGRLAILHAAGDARVRCVVDYFGGIGAQGARRLTRMPPVDVVGLAGDTAVAMLRDALTRLGGKNEFHDYAGRAGQLSPSDRRDAGQGVERFLESCVPAR